MASKKQAKPDAEANRRRAGELHKKAQLIIKKKGPPDLLLLAAEMLCEAIALKPSAPLYHHRGRCFVLLEQHQRALYDFSMCIRLDANAKTYATRGRCLQRCGRLKEAIQDFTDALSLEKDNSWLHLERAMIYFDCCEFQEAQQGCNLAIQLSPDKPLSAEKMAKAFLTRGICFRELGDLDPSLAMLKQACETDNDAETQYQMGLTHSARKDYTAAIKCFSDALDIDDMIRNSRRLEEGRPKYLNNRGLALYHMEQHDDAIDDFTQALEMGEDAAIFFNRGNTSFAQEKYGQALTDYQAATRCHPSCLYTHYAGLALVALGRVREAIDVFVQAIALDDEHVPSYLQLGTMYFRDGQLENARDVFSHPAIESRGLTDEVLFERRGCVHRALGSNDLAYADFDRAVQINPCGKYYYYRGNILRRMGRYKEANQDFDSALECGCDDLLFECLNDRGLAQRALGNLPHAAADLTKACELQPRSDVWVSRAQCYYEQGYLDRAESDLDEALEHGGSFEIYHQRGLARYAQNRFAEASLDLEEALKYGKGSADIYYQLGLSYANAGDYESAASAFDNALDREPNHVHVLHERANSLAMIGNCDRALTDFNKVLALQPKNSRAHFRRGFSYKALQMYEEAVEDFEAARELDPSDTRLALSYRHLDGVRMISLGPHGFEDPNVADIQESETVGNHFLQ